MHVYHSYGVYVGSSWVLPYREETASRPIDIELIEASESRFQGIGKPSEPAADPDRIYTFLPGGSIYICWPGVFECLISPDGSRVEGRVLEDVPPESIHSHVLGQLLSFALLKRGVEVLHGTAVVVDGEAVAFLGDSGFGKSTLGAAFVRTGYQLLTDDLLVVRERRERFHVFPGPPRIKLFPEIVSSLFGRHVHAKPINSRTTKVMLPVEATRHCESMIPLKAIYLLAPPGHHDERMPVLIQRVSPRQAFMSLVENTFNSKLVERERLKGQFALNGAIAGRVPIKALAYTRRVEMLPEVRDAVLRDLDAS
jgi:hypothetical protein